MMQSLGAVSLVVRDYDEAIGFFAGVLGFEARIGDQTGGRVFLSYGNLWDLVQRREQNA